MIPFIKGYSKLHGNLFVHCTLFYFGKRKRLSRRGTIGRQSVPGTQLDSSEVADHHHQDIGKFQRINLSQDRFAGSARRFSVVVGTKGGAIRSQHVSPANMAGIVILFSKLINLFFYLLYGANRNSIGYKAASASQYSSYPPLR